MTEMKTKYLKRNVFGQYLKRYCIRLNKYCDVLNFYFLYKKVTRVGLKINQSELVFFNQSNDRMYMFIDQSKLSIFWREKLFLSKWISCKKILGCLHSGTISRYKYNCQSCIVSHSLLGGSVKKKLLSSTYEWYYYCYHGYYRENLSLCYMW